MTMLQVYGFDVYDNTTELVTIESEWTQSSGSGGAVNILTTGGRFGEGALQLVEGLVNQTATLTFTSLQPKAIFFGVSFFSNAVGTNTTFLIFRDGGSEHLHLQQALNDVVEVYILGVLQGSTFLLSKTQWHRLEINLIVDNAVGEVTIRLDETEVFTVTGIDTQAGSNEWTNKFIFLSERNGPNMVFDDVTINDDQGTENNTWLDDVRIETLRPDGAGFVTDFTPSAGANWENVDEATGPDEDTTFNQSSTVGHQDLYTTTDLTGSPDTIHAVLIRATARKDDAGSRTIELLSRTGGSTDVGATQTLLTSYSNFQEMHDIDPTTGVSWITSGVNAMEIGLENN